MEKLVICTGSFVCPRESGNSCKHMWTHYASHFGEEDDLCTREECGMVIGLRTRYFKCEEWNPKMEAKLPRTVEEIN
jgi:hypothetical protein